MAKRNRLDDLDIASAPDLAEVKPGRRRKRKQIPVDDPLSGTRIGKDVRAGNRKPPPVPKNKSLAEIDAMDPDDPEFKHPDGRKRKVRDPNDWKDVARADKINRQNERRAKARKAEAKVVKAVEVIENRASRHDKRKGIYDEDLAIAEGVLELDDWDNEELIRGYRRNRNGNFGPPPKFIPREIQQEIFRRIVTRGDKKMRGAYLDSIEGLIDLAHNATSEKVRLEAIRELQNRVVGKVPDRVHVAQEQPWEQFLADSIQPIGDEDLRPPSGEAVDHPALPIRPYMEDDTERLDEGS